MLSWQKKGLFVEPDHSYFWMHSHTMTPTVLHLEGNHYRVFFSGRNNKNQSHIGYVDIKVDPEKKEIKGLGFSEQPVLGPGELGCFDDSGVTPSCVMKVDGKIYLYYIGWRSKSTVRMELITGLAISDDGVAFKRYSRAPLLTRNDNEPISILTSPDVIKDGDLYKMWYVSGIRWVHADLPQYDIKYAESRDGIDWNQTGLVAISLRGGENALARPFVVKENNLYRMWYSYKKDCYRIGYAESSDGLNWTRMDEEVGIFPSKNGWDSEMNEYAVVFEHEGTNYMLYNGNDYGSYGIGYAVQI